MLFDYGHIKEILKKNMGYNFTKIWKINNRLVVADTIEDAISLYKQYACLNDSVAADITNIAAVGDGDIPQTYFAIVKS